MAQRANCNVPFWLLDTLPVFRGADVGDDDGSGGGNDGDDDGNGDDPPEGGSSGGPGGDNISREDYNALQERMKLADRNKARAQKELQDSQQKLKEFEDKDKSDLERAQAEAKDAQANSESATAAMDSMRIEVAFLKNNKHEWHDPAVALKLLDDSDIQIDDKGEVTGLKEAIDKLAKDCPFLVKSKSKDDDTDKNSGKKQKSGASNNGPAGGGNRTDRQKLEQDFPALRGR